VNDKDEGGIGFEFTEDGIFLGSVSAKDKDKAIERIKAEIKIVPVNMIISYNLPNL